MAGGTPLGDPHGRRGRGGGRPEVSKEGGRRKIKRGGEPQGVLVQLYKSQKGLMLSTASWSFELTIQFYREEIRDADLSKSERRISTAPCYRRTRGEVAASWNEPWAEVPELALQGSPSPHGHFAAAAERPSWAGFEPRVSRGGLRCEQQKPRPRLSPSAARPRWAAVARAAPSSPHVLLGLGATRRLPALPSGSAGCSGCTGTVPRGTSTVLTVPALFQPCASLCQDCPKAVPDCTGTVPDVSALSLTIPGQLQSNPALCQYRSRMSQHYRSCSNTVSYPVLASPQLSQHCPTIVTDCSSPVPDYPSELP